MTKIVALNPESVKFEHLRKFCKKKHLAILMRYLLIFLISLLLLSRIPDGLYAQLKD